MSDPAKSLSVSLAEEIAKELIDGKNPAVDIGDYSNGSYDEELAAQIIQRRVEPLERQRDEAIALLEACQEELRLTDGCVLVRGLVRSFLARIKEGR